MNINTKQSFLNISSFTPNSKSCNSDFQQSLAQRYTKSNESTFLAQHKYSSGNCDDGSQYDWLYDSKIVQEKIDKGELIKFEEYDYFIPEQGMGIRLLEYYKNQPLSKNDPMGYLKQAWNLFTQIVGEDFNPNGNGYITREQYMQLPKGIELKGNVYDGIATIYGDNASVKIAKEKDWNLISESKSSGFMEIFSDEEWNKDSKGGFITIDSLFHNFIFNGLRSAEVEYSTTAGNGVSQKTGYKGQESITKTIRVKFLLWEKII